MKRKLIALLASVALVVTGAISANADGYMPPVPMQGENGFTIIDDNFMAGDKASYIYSEIPGTSETNPSNATLCTAYKANGCVENSTQSVIGNIILGVCQGDEVNCIEGISVYKKGTTPTPAVLEKVVPGPNTPADQSADIPRGATVGVYKSAGVAHGGGTETYTAYAKVRFHMVAGKAVFEDFVAGVVPTTESSERGSPTPEVRLRANKYNTYGIEIMNSGPHCVYNYDMKCAHTQDFAPDTRVAMTMRISNRLTGWLKGRLQDPQISLTTFNTAYNRLTVDANPTSVPQLSAFFSSATLPPAVATVAPFIAENVKSGRSGSSSLRASEHIAFDMIDAVREFSKDKSTGTATTWSFASLNQNFATANACLADTKRLVGMVTTNSMAYEGTAPQFSNGILNYKVAGMHYLADGTEASGVYDLVMRSDTARCLYHFTSAPISATVSVTSSNGEAKAAVTSFKEDAGWVHFGAYGFSFSQPIINVKMTQAKVVTKKTTITCINTKKTSALKKVTGINPKCPTGYIKKS